MMTQFDDAYASLSLNELKTILYVLSCQHSPFQLNSDHRQPWLPAMGMYGVAMVSSKFGLRFPYIFRMLYGTYMLLPRNMNPVFAT